MTSTRLRPLELELFLRWKKSPPPRRLLVACSGGRDSVAALEILSTVAPRLNLLLAVAHVHHGRAAEREQAKYRRDAFRFVQQLSREKGLPFYALRPSHSRVLKGEAAARQFRERALKVIRERAGFDQVVFAHHADDLFETRVIRLVRGTGIKGLGAMIERNDWKLRPFLETRSSELGGYATKWVDDPSNADLRYLRNWIRHEWIPSLEAKRPGAAKAFARSLQHITEANTPDKVAGESFVVASPVKQRAMIADHLRHAGAEDFGTGHVEEIRKRITTGLARGHKEIRFSLLRFEWIVRGGEITISPL